MQTQEVTKVVIDEKFIIDAVNEKLAKANLKTVKPYNVSTGTRLEGYGPGEHEASYIPDAIVECINYRKHFPRKYHWYAVRICIKDAKTHQRLLDWQTTVGFTIQNRVLFDENILNTASKPDLPKHVQVKVDAGETIHFSEINTYLGYMAENTQERNE